MLKRTLLFSNPAHLSTKKQQLVVNYPDEQVADSVPIEDISVLILENSQITISHTLISLLLGNNVALITCDAHHLPQGLMLNLNGHSEQQEHFRAQISAADGLKAQLWKQTVFRKIKNQAQLLKMNGTEAANMDRWADLTSAGDPQNYEGRAAAVYWQKLFVEVLEKFKRGRFEEAPNNLLNYGYAILRGVIARALIGSGLLPTLGYHHRNKYNAYCLADDVMEPYRPFVDQLVLEIVRGSDAYDELTPTLKKELLQIPTLDVMIENKKRPLMIAAQQTTSSLYKCFAKKQKHISFPEL